MHDLKERRVLSRAKFAKLSLALYYYACQWLWRTGRSDVSRFEYPYSTTGDGDSVLLDFFDSLRPFGSNARARAKETEKARAGAPL